MCLYWALKVDHNEGPCISMRSASWYHTRAQAYGWKEDFQSHRHASKEGGRQESLTDSSRFEENGSSVVKRLFTSNQPTVSAERHWFAVMHRCQKIASHWPYEEAVHSVCREVCTLGIRWVEESHILRWRHISVVPDASSQSLLPCFLQSVWPCLHSADF